MIDTLFCFVTCLVRDRIREGRRRRRKRDDKDKRLYRYKRTKDRKMERERQSSNKDRLPPLSVYIGDLSL
jgi:hypothetical protein